MDCLTDHTHMTLIACANIQMHVCQTCNSVWLEGSQLQKLTTYLASGKLDATFNRWMEVHSNGKTDPRVFWQESVRICPDDHSPLQKHYFAGDSGIGIDNCALCNGFWIDGDEMKALMKYTAPNPERDAAFLSLLDEDKNFQKDINEMKTIPATLATLLINPYYAAFLIFQHVAKLIVEELDAH